MPKCRQVSAAFLPCSSYQSIMRSRCFASLESSRARTALTARGMFSQKFLIPAITHVYGIYLNEITLPRHKKAAPDRAAWRFRVSWASGRLELVNACPQRVGVLKPLGVQLRVLFPLVGHVVLGEDRGHRAHRLAGAAVDALVGVDVELAVGALFEVDAVHGAHLDARLVDDIDAGLRDNVGYDLSSCCQPACFITIGSRNLGNSLPVVMLARRQGASQGLFRPTASPFPQTNKPANKQTCGRLVCWDARLLALGWREVW